MTSRRSVLSGAAWLAGLGGLAWFARDQIAPQGLTFEGPNRSSGWLPFAERRARLPVIMAGVGGRMVKALVDSGAQMSVVDRAFADELQMPAAFTAPVIAYGIGGQPQAARGVAFDLAVGDLTLRGFRALALSLGPLAQADLDTPLVIGQDILSSLVADIDFPGRRIAFHRREAFAMPEEALAVPARTLGRGLRAQVTIEDRPVEVVVDTGATDTLALSRATAQEIGLLDGRPMRRSRALVLGGMAEGGVVEAEGFAFADRRLETVDVHLYDAQPTPGFPPGLLGVEAFGGRRVILDIGGGRLALV